MTVRICCDAEEKILQQNAFAYDKWSVYNDEGLLVIK